MSGFFYVLAIALNAALATANSHFHDIHFYLVHKLSRPDLASD